MRYTDRLFSFWASWPNAKNSLVSPTSATDAVRQSPLMWHCTAPGSLACLLAEPSVDWSAGIIPDYWATLPLTRILGWLFWNLSTWEVFMACFRNELDLQMTVKTNTFPLIFFTFEMCTLISPIHSNFFFYTPSIFNLFFVFCFCTCFLCFI